MIFMLRCTILHSMIPLSSIIMIYSAGIIRLQPIHYDQLTRESDIFHFQTEIDLNEKTIQTISVPDNIAYFLQTISSCASIMVFIFGCSLHCKCLQGFTGFPQVFSAISMEKGCKNHRETLYSSKGKVAYVVRKPCNIYRLRGKPYDYYRISPQSVNITGFPHNIHNLSL